MENRPEFDPQLSLEALNEILQSLSNYSIPKRRLKLRETLGEGGFGTVRLGDLRSSSWTYLSGTSTAVAVKEFHTYKSDVMPLESAFRLAREMKVWVSCKHENILEFTGYRLSKNFREAYLVSPYMKNGNIKNYLAREKPSMERRLEFVWDTAKGIQYLHTRDPPMVHGDLKSLNVLVSNEEKALLSDFGLAEAMEDNPTGLSTSSSFKGTTRYCSPEILKGSPRECSSDIWGWGCLALEIITDNRPYHEVQRETQVLLLICGQEDYRRSPEPSGTSSIPPTSLQLLKKCWAFVPKKRPSATSCVYALGSIILLPPSWNPDRRMISLERIHLLQGMKAPSPLPNDIVVAKVLSPDQSVDQSTLVTMRKIGGNGHRSPRDVLDFIYKVSILKHENLLDLAGYCPEWSDLYVLSPYMYNGNIKNYLSKNQPQLEVRMSLVQDILKGLQYLHSPTINIVHGALCPRTVLVNGEGNALLCNIGIGTLWTRDELFGLHSPYHLWCSPEAIHNRPTSSNADIWSWACVTLDVVFGIRPFGSTGASLNRAEMERLLESSTPDPRPTPIVSGTLLKLLRRCWIRDPSQRPSATDCLVEFDRVLCEGIVSAVDCWVHSSDKPQIQNTFFTKSELKEQLASFSLPENLFIPSKRVPFSLKYPFGYSPFSDIKFSELFSEDLSRKVEARVTMWRTEGPGSHSFADVVEKLGRVSTLKHENLLELTGYCLNEDWSVLFFVSPYMNTIALAGYIGNLRQKTERPRRGLLLLRDILKGLQYLHSSTVNMAHGALNLWTVLVNL